MKWDFKRELARKAIHLATLLILVIYLIASDIFNRKIAMLILVFILITDLELEYFRIEVGRKIPVLSIIWKHLRRKKEKNTIGGDVFFLIGAIIVLSVFDLKIAASAILMTTFGDMAAALVGKKFGKHKVALVKKKSWEGVAAEFIVDILVALIVLSWKNFNIIYSVNTLIIAAAMALTATSVETIITKMDDNLFIPIFSGFLGEILMLILGGL